MDGSEEKFFDVPFVPREGEKVQFQADVENPTDDDFYEGLVTEVRHNLSTGAIRVIVRCSSDDVSSAYGKLVGEKDKPANWDD